MNGKSRPQGAAPGPTKTSHRVTRDADDHAYQRHLADRGAREQARRDGEALAAVRRWRQLGLGCPCGCLTKPGIFDDPGCARHADKAVRRG